MFCRHRPGRPLPLDLRPSTWPLQRHRRSDLHDRPPVRHCRQTRCGRRRRQVPLSQDRFPAGDFADCGGGVRPLPHPTSRRREKSAARMSRDGRQAEGVLGELNLRRRRRRGRGDRLRGRRSRDAPCSLFLRFRISGAMFAGFGRMDDRMPGVGILREDGNGVFPSRELDGRRTGQLSAIPSHGGPFRRQTLRSDMYVGFYRFRV